MAPEDTPRSGTDEMDDVSSAFAKTTTGELQEVAEGI
jgi:hypothetical protein